jgi:hypothetical protein
MSTKTPYVLGQQSLKERLSSNALDIETGMNVSHHPTQAGAGRSGYEAQGTRDQDTWFASITHHLKDCEDTVVLYFKGCPSAAASHQPDYSTVCHIATPGAVRKQTENVVRHRARRALRQDRTHLPLKEWSVDGSALAGDAMAGDLGSPMNTTNAPVARSNHPKMSNRFSRNPNVPNPVDSDTEPGSDQMQNVPVQQHSLITGAVACLSSSNYHGGKNSLCTGIHSMFGRPDTVDSDTTPNNTLSGADNPEHGPGEILGTDQVGRVNGSTSPVSKTEHLLMATNVSGVFSEPGQTDIKHKDEHCTPIERERLFQLKENPAPVAEETNILGSAPVTNNPLRGERQKQYRKISSKTIALSQGDDRKRLVLANIVEAVSVLLLPSVSDTRTSSLSISTV